MIGEIMSMNVINRMPAETAQSFIVRAGGGRDLTSIGGSLVGRQCTHGEIADHRPESVLRPA